MACIDNFIDPRNTPQIIEKIKSLPTLGDIKPLLDETFPDWIIGSMTEYSSDYPHLQRNWETICKTAKIKPVGIVIVKDIVFDDNHTLIQMFAETLTKAGFVVRRKGELMPCDNCNSAIPHPNLYDKMKLGGLPVPKRWARTCMNCRKV
jgi:hypothetical protein